MAEFLDSNPGLASRFGTRVHFPSYRPSELLQIADYHTGLREDRLDPEAGSGSPHGSRRSNGAASSTNWETDGSSGP